MWAFCSHSNLILMSLIFNFKNTLQCYTSNTMKPCTISSNKQKYAIVYQFWLKCFCGQFDCWCYLKLEVSLTKWGEYPLFNIIRLVHWMCLCTQILLLWMPNFLAFRNAPFLPARSLGNWHLMAKIPLKISGSMQCQMFLKFQRKASTVEGWNISTHGGGGGTWRNKGLSLTPHTSPHDNVVKTTFKEGKSLWAFLVH